MPGNLPQTDGEVLDVPLPEPLHGDAAEARHKRIAERARRKQARETLLRVAMPVSEIVRREALPPLVGRDAELSRLSALLVGPEHAGKSAMVRAYAAAGGHAVWGTSGAQLIAGTSGLGQWQERVRDVMDAVHELDGVLYFESLDDLLAERMARCARGSTRARCGSARRSARSARGRRRAGTGRR
jgi:ATP-dependent Clp protease ATP-binding subunit ClpC